MRALIADDDRITTTILAHALEPLQLDLSIVHDGAEAWTCLTSDRTPALAILDWEMPGMDGVDICRRSRSDITDANPYLILLTSRDARSDIVAGLDSGADDYLIKPIDPEELRARVRVGLRILGLQTRLADRVAELQRALTKVTQLSGLLPICSYCKRVRTDQDYWEQVESYVSLHSDMQFSHGICPPCFERVTANLPP